MHGSECGNVLGPRSIESMLDNLFSQVLFSPPGEPLELSRGITACFSLMDDSGLELCEVTNTNTDDHVVIVRPTLDNRGNPEATISQEGNEVGVVCSIITWNTLGTPYQYTLGTEDGQENQLELENKVFEVYEEKLKLIGKIHDKHRKAVLVACKGSREYELLKADIVSLVDLDLYEDFDITPELIIGEQTE